MSVVWSWSWINIVVVFAAVALALADGAAGLCAASYLHPLTYLSVCFDLNYSM